MFENWCPSCTPFTISILVFEKRDFFFFRNLDFSFYLLLGRKIQNIDKIRRMTHVLPIRCWRATFSSLFILLDGRVETQSAWETILIYILFPPLFSLPSPLFLPLVSLLSSFEKEGINDVEKDGHLYILSSWLESFLLSTTWLSLGRVWKKTTTTTFLFPV